MGSNTLWSKKEIEILKNNYEIKGPTICSKILENRTVRACQIKAKLLGIKFNRSYKYEKNILTDLVNNSQNKKDCLKKLNLTLRPGNYDTLNKYIKLYNLDISHFKNDNYRLSEFFIKNIKKKLSEILIENSTYNRSSLKKRLYDEGLKERICELCGQGEKWNNMKISLILDHINGINDDNRIENLRIVCPNCNAGLKTHCKGNRKSKKIKYYCECGNEKGKKAKNCEKCYHKKQRKVERPPYDQLVKEIKETNYCAVGRKYGVTDKAIRKWIKNYME